jgi:outer membrane lipoprotein LolB
VSLPDRRHKRWIFNVLLLVVGVAVGGCTTTPVTPPAPGGFLLRGKLAVVDGSESVSARFLWQQTGDEFRIDLWGPFGQGQMRLEGDTDELVLRDAAGKVLTRGSHEDVMRTQLGWTLPLAVLPLWIQGRPHPGVSVTGSASDAAGHLEQFHQLDWAVVLGRWGPAKNPSAGREMPHRVSATRGVYRVRLAISEWQI